MQNVGRKVSDGKNYQKNKILDENVYLLELIVFDDWVTKISLNSLQFSIHEKFRGTK